MTKIHRQPKPKRPAKKRVTLAQCKRLADQCGLILQEYEHILFTIGHTKIDVYHSSRSAALRVMKAALEAMKEEGK